MSCILATRQISGTGNYLELTFYNESIKTSYDFGTITVTYDVNGETYKYDKQVKVLIMNLLESMINHFKVCHKCRSTYAKDVSEIIKYLKFVTVK